MSLKSDQLEFLLSVFAILPKSQDMPAINKGVDSLRILKNWSAPLLFNILYTRLCFESPQRQIFLRRVVKDKLITRFRTISPV